MRLDVQENLITTPAHFDALSTAEQTHTVVQERSLHKLRGIGLFSGQYAVGGFDQDDLRAEAGKSLRQLASDRARANDSDWVGKLGQRKHGLVGEIVNLVKAGNGWGRRTRSGGDDRLAESERPPGNSNRIRAGELAIAEEDVDAEVAEPGRRIVSADPGAGLRIRSIAAPKSAFHPSGTCTPNGPASRTAAAIRAALIMPLDGTQP